MIKRALISVWDKTGVVKLASFLSNNNIEIYSTGGTMKMLVDSGIKVKNIADLTSTGSIMDGRVKTLHPKVFGGILADRGNESHMQDLDSIDGKLFDLIVVNFYPFVKEAVNKNLSIDDAIEYIDIGGPSMLRSAAKNFNNTVPLSSPILYDRFMELYDKHKQIPRVERIKYAKEVFELTSKYEIEILNYFKQDDLSIGESYNVLLN